MMMVDPDDLDDDQTEIFEAGYVAGQAAVAARLRQMAREYERFAELFAEDDEVAPR